MTRAGPRTVLAKDDEIERILTHSKTWLRAFILMCRLLGLRNSEARRLTPTNWDPVTNTISFKRKMAGTSNLPVPPQLHQLISLAHQQGPHSPIIETLGCTRNSNYAILRAWTRAKKAAKADPNLHIHDLRRTIATQLYNHSKDIRAVQQLLGHRNLMSTLQYIAPADPEYLRGLMADLKPIQLRAMPPATEVKQ